ncbi:unnamed protein product, partial [Prunus brigantina]
SWLLISNKPFHPYPFIHSRIYPSHLIKHKHTGPGYILTNPHKITYHSPYDGTYPASYGACQHAGYSYDTCDLTQSHWAWLHSHQPIHNHRGTWGSAYSTEYLDQHIINSGPSNGPNLANPENTRYAISVWNPNGIQIEIRAHLCAHDIERVALG